MGGGNSRMMLENRLTNSIENNINNHTNLVNKTSQSVTQEYVDKVKNSTSTKSAITQVTRLRNIRVSDEGKLIIEQRGQISASIIAQNMITSQLNDRTNLANVMSSALQQAVTAQADMDTSQKAVNVMEQMDQNNGGLEGMVAKLADTVTNVFGGGNTEQDIKNILDNSIKSNVNNELNMENVIETTLNKRMEAETINECQQELSIEQITEMENVEISGKGLVQDIKDASIDSAVKCFNQVYNIRDISTEMSTASGQTADQTTKATNELKSKQDTNNKLKQTKIQKNLLDSFMQGCQGSCMMIVIIVVVLASKGGGGGGGGSGSGGKKKTGTFGAIFMFFIVVFIIGLIILTVKHKEAFTGTKLGSALGKLEGLNPNSRFNLETTRDGTFKIVTADGSMQLIPTSNHPSELNIETRPSNSLNLEFTDAIDDEATFNFTEFTAAVQVDNDARESGDNPPLYKIFHGTYQLGFLYSDNVRGDSNKIVVEPILYQTGSISPQLSDKFVFSISPNLNSDSSSGYTISHVNINKSGDPEDHDLENNMIGFLQTSDKPLNGGLFREDDNTIMGAEFRFS